MQEKLTKLYSTLLNIETKGQSTKLMGACLQYLEQLISESSELESIKNDNKSEGAIDV